MRTSVFLPVCLPLAACCGSHTRSGGVTPPTKQAAAATQYAPVLGHLMGTPLAFTTTQKKSPEVRAPGFAMQAPQVPSDVPNIDFSRFHSDVFGDFPANHHPVAAFSMGTEVINVVKQLVDSVEFQETWSGQEHYVMVVGNHGWFTILFNVSGTVPASPKPDVDGTIAPAVAKATNQGKVLYACTIPSSYEQADGPLHYLTAERDTVEALLAPHMSLADSERLRGVDLTAALYKSDLPAKPQFQHRLLTTPSIYFTLRAAFLETVPASYWMEKWSIAPGDVSNSVVFKSNWTGTQWAKPTIYKNIPKLSLGDVDEIDGLAIDTVQSPPVLMLSTTNASTVDQEIRLVVGASDPQPVLVKKGPRYRTLGRELQAGKAVGDFCTADPWLVDPPFRITYETTKAVPDVPDDFIFARRQLHEGPDRVIELPISAIRTWNSGAAVKICMSRPTGLAAGTPHLFWAHSDDIRTGAPRDGEWHEVPIASPNGTTIEQTVMWQAHPAPADAAYPGMAFYWTLTNGQPHYSHVATIREPK